MEDNFIKQSIEKHVINSEVQFHESDRTWYSLVKNDCNLLLISFDNKELIFIYKNYPLTTQSNTQRKPLLSYRY